MFQTGIRWSRSAAVRSFHRFAPVEREKERPKTGTEAKEDDERQERPPGIESIRRKRYSTLFRLLFCLFYIPFYRVRCQQYIRSRKSLFKAPPLRVLRNVVLRLQLLTTKEQQQIIFIADPPFVTLRERTFFILVPVACRTSKHGERSLRATNVSHLCSSTVRARLQTVVVRRQRRPADFATDRGEHRRFARERGLPRPRRRLDLPSPPPSPQTVGLCEGVDEETGDAVSGPTRRHAAVEAETELRDLQPRPFGDRLGGARRMFGEFVAVRGVCRLPR